MGFYDLFHYLKATFDVSDDLAWKLCVKSKRGFADTAQKGSFTKDIVYFVGLRDIDKYLDRGGSIEELYVGKVSIESLPLVQKIEGLKEAKYLL